MPHAPARLPRTVWALGFFSLFTDTSSELVHSLLPLYLATGLGVSMVMIGLVEGIAEATAQIVKVFSGTLSDFLGRRKLLTIVGYGLAALSKPVFPLAGSVGWVFAAHAAIRFDLRYAQCHASPAAERARTARAARSGRHWRQ